MDFTLIKTLPGEPDFLLFESILDRIYPPLSSTSKKKEIINPDYLHAAYVLMSQDKAVARCCLYHNPLLRYQGDSACCIGNFESIDNADCSGELLRLVAKEAQALGSSFVIGPMNGSTWNNYRLGLNPEMPAFFLEPDAPAYYPDLFLKAGFQPIARYVSHKDEIRRNGRFSTEKYQEPSWKNTLHFRELDLENYEVELKKLYRFCMQSFIRNFLFTPISEDTFMMNYLRLKPYLDARYIILAEDADNNLVGLVFCVPNHYDTVRRGLIVKTIARNPLADYKGLGSALAGMIETRAISGDYDYLIHALMLDSNVSRQISEQFSGTAWKEYALYGKTISTL